MSPINSCYAGRLVAFFALVLPPLAQAETYKWVDKEGNTVYSQSRPPVHTPAETIKPPPKVDTERAWDELDQTIMRLERLRDDRIQRKDKERVLADELKVKEKNCAKAKDKLSRVSTLPRVYAQDQQGNRRRLTEEERQARTAEAQKEIEKYCH